MQGQIHFNQIHDTMILEENIERLLFEAGYGRKDIEYVLGIEDMRTREVGEVVLELIERIVEVTSYIG